RTFGSRAQDLIVAIGPAISGPNYEVGADVYQRFAAAGFTPADRARWFVPAARAEHWYFDGWQSACDQLQAVEVPASQIFVAGLCAFGHPGVLCSYRRDGSPAGRMAAAIRMKR